MSTFQISNEIPAPVDDVWKIVSDIDREPEYWHGTKSVMNIRKVGNMVERETVIAFRNSVCKEIVTSDAKTQSRKELLMALSGGQRILSLHQLEQTKHESM